MSVRVALHAPSAGDSVTMNLRPGWGRPRSYLTLNPLAASNAQPRPSNEPRTMSRRASNLLRSAVRRSIARVNSSSNTRTSDAWWVSTSILQPPPLDCLFVIEDAQFRPAVRLQQCEVRTVPRRHCETSVADTIIALAHCRAVCGSVLQLRGHVADGRYRNHAWAVTSGLFQLAQIAGPVPARPDTRQTRQSRSW